MSFHQAAFDGSMPERYSRRLNNPIRGAYIAQMANRLVPHACGPVLEVACGSGTLTKHLREALPSTVPLVVTDLDEETIRSARQQFQGLSNTRWQRADLNPLPFAAASFSAAACQFGTIYADRVGHFQELRRVLAPGGVLVFNVFFHQTFNPFARIAEAIISVYMNTGGPEVSAESLRLHDQLRMAGFDEIRIDAVPLETSRVPLQTVEAGHLIALGGDEPVHTELQAAIVSARARR